MGRGSTATVILVSAACLTLLGPTASWAWTAHPTGASGLCVKATAQILPHGGLNVGDDYSAFTGVSDCGAQGHHHPFFKFVFLFNAPCVDGWHVHHRFHFKYSGGIGIQSSGSQVPCVGIYRVETWAYYRGQLIAHAKHRVIVRH